MEYAIGTEVRDPETGLIYNYIGNGLFVYDGDVYDLAGVNEEVVAPVLTTIDTNCG
jgi:hypothetical protein